MQETKEKVKHAVNMFYHEACVYVSGWVVCGDFTAASDVDVLVVLPKPLMPNERTKLQAEVFKALPQAPVELHISDKRQFHQWYSSFILPDGLIEV